MNPHSAAILTNPHPCGHIVYPYTDESLVEHAVGLFASAGIRNGEAVILIMTSDHFEPIRLRLRMEGCNVATLERIRIADLPYDRRLAGHVYGESDLE